MELLNTVADYAKAISAILALAFIFIKPFREWLLGMGAIHKGQKCLLRSEMLHIYYEYKDQKKIRQFEYENFLYLYDAYKSLKGNSFIDQIKSAVDTWEVIT